MSHKLEFLGKGRYCHWLHRWSLLQWPLSNSPHCRFPGENKWLWVTRKESQVSTHNGSKRDTIYMQAYLFCTLTITVGLSNSFHFLKMKKNIVSNNKTESVSTGIIES